MLYDNALLSRVYLHAYQASGDPFFRRVVEQTLDYILREMTSPEGGFYSTQDADSEGEEGKFFVWTPEEVEALLGNEDGPLFRAYFDVTEAGNFEHKNILHVDHSLEEVAARLSVTPERLSEAIESGKRILFEAREKRVKPGRDDKVLTAWNGLTLVSMAEAEDHAYLPDGLLALYQAVLAQQVRVLAIRCDDDLLLAPPFQVAGGLFGLGLTLAAGHLGRDNSLIFA
jgi:uncharacterized protein YyaL (SSP411 family)